MKYGNWKRNMQDSGPNVKDVQAPYTMKCYVQTKIVILST